jgi:amidase
VTVEVHLRRLAEENPRLNAVISDRAAAVRAEAARSAAGPLTGVVFTVKDVISTADLPTTCGSRLRGDGRTARDAPAVRRMRGAGAILLGKTNCPEFALGVHTDNPRYGRTHNPLGPFTVGGSSGGEAAAVASGISTVGLGTDFGGSIRWPAQCAGLTGLRPTVGRVPGAGQFPWLEGPAERTTLQGAVQVIGPIGRTVDDVAAAFAILANTPREPGAIAEVRWSGNLADDSAVAVAVEWAAGVLAGAGVPIARDLSSTMEAAADVYDRLRATDPMDAIAEVARGREHLLDGRTRALLAARMTVDPGVRRGLWAERARLIAVLAEYLRPDRLLLLPVSVRRPFPPPTLDEPPDPAEFDVLRPCRAVSLFGFPAISVPAPPAPDGVPVSVQLVAGPGGEERLFTAARWIEEARSCGYR